MNDTKHSADRAGDMAALSALADGDAALQDAALALWRNDADARRNWHAWHLAGDVMRSEDLSAPASRDSAFVAALRTRLAAEPMPLAPAAASTPAVAALVDSAAAADPAQRRWRGAWLSPVAAAAGVAAVAGVLVLTRTSSPGAGPGDSPVVAAAPRVQPGLSLAGQASGQPGQLVIEGRMVYDPNYVNYLRFHRERALRPMQPWGQPVPAAAAASGR